MLHTLIFPHLTKPSSAFKDVLPFRILSSYLSILLRQFFIIASHVEAFNHLGITESIDFRKLCLT